MRITAINGMGSISFDGSNYSTEGLKDLDIMHLSEDLFLNAGVAKSTDLVVSQNHLGADRSVDFSAGIAYILNSAWAANNESNTKYYRGINPSVANVALTTNTSGNPRIDLICAKVDTVTTPNGDASNVFSFFVEVGTPGASPSAPAVPNDCLALAQVTLAHNYTQVTNANITDRRIEIGLVRMDQWIPLQEEWVRTGNHTFTITGLGNVTARYRKGAKIKYVDSSGATEYGVIASSSYGSPTVTVNLIPNIDYEMATGTVIKRYISYVDTPEGFPDFFNWTPVHTGFSVDPTIVARWKVSGSSIMISYSATGSGTSNATTYTITLPVTPVSLAGAVNWMLPIQCVDNGALITTQWGKLRIRDNVATADLYTTPGTGGWTNSGGKYAEFVAWYEF